MLSDRKTVKGERGGGYQKISTHLLRTQAAEEVILWDFTLIKKNVEM